MSDLISTPPAPASPVGSTVIADGWFPAVDVNQVRDRMRLGENIVTHARLVAAIEGAMLTALRQLAGWRAVQVGAGVAALANVADIMIGSTPRPVILWHRIIRYYAAAEIADGYRDLVAADQQSQRADDARQSADDYRRIAHNAVADLLSVGAESPVLRNAVELI